MRNLSSPSLRGLARVCATFLVPAAMFQSAIAQVIPAGRTIDWTQAGVPGGIPTNRFIFTNVSGLDTNGVLDCSAGIQAAINACPSNGIVVLPAGNLVISNLLAISFNTIKKGGYITLRGAGPTNTILINQAPAGVFGTGAATFSQVQSNNLIVSSLLQGATNMWATAPVDCGPGDTLLISRQDEPGGISSLIFNNNGLTNSHITTNIVAGNPYYYGEGIWSRTQSGDVLSQVVQCTSVINQTNVQFWPPLYLSWTNSFGPYAYVQWQQGTSAGVGLEDLQITNATANLAALQHVLVQFESYGCWAKNCKFYGYAGGQGFVNMANCLNCEIRDCDFQCAISNVPDGDCIGLEEVATCASKFENNTFSGFGDQLLMNSSSSGNVFTYNYFTNDYQIGSISSHYIEPDIYVSHKAFDSMNLFEGNVMGQFQADNYHGGCGYNTLFRNWIHGMDCPYGIPLTNNIKCIDLDRYSYYFNLVGNVVGSPSLAAATSSVSVAPTDGGFNPSINAMYRLGFPDMGNDIWNDSDVYVFYQGESGTTVYNYRIGYDTNVTATLFRADNYDYVTAGIPDGKTNLPPSLVYGTNPPGWWPSKLPWPAIGPDVNPMTGLIPAEIRYYNSLAASFTLPGVTNSSTNSVSLPPPTGLRIVAEIGSGTSSSTNGGSGSNGFASGSAYSPSTDGSVFEWLKADAINQGNNTAVATWPASIGASLVNPNSGMTQPIFKTAQQNGLPAVLFNGANSTYLATPANFASQSQPFTIFIAFKDNDSTFSIPIGPSGGSDIRWVHQAYGVYDISAGGAGSGPAEPVTDNNWHILMLVFNGSSSKWRQDGGSVTSFGGQTGSNSVNSISLGGYQSNIDNATIAVGEVILYSGDQSASADTIFSYLDSRWGVYSQ